MPEETRSTLLIEESIRSIVQTSSEVARTVAELPEQALRWKPAAMCGPSRKFSATCKRPCPIGPARWSAWP